MKQAFVLLFKLGISAFWIAGALLVIFTMFSWGQIQGYGSDVWQGAGDVVNEITANF